MNLIKQRRHQSKKLMASARGRDCTIRIPGYCIYNPETTVGAHLNGAGLGTKQSDLFIAYGCSGCHALVDAPHLAKEYTREQIQLMHYQGVIRTIQIMLDEELIKLP